jgi:phosphoglycolate phosphatase
MNLRAALFDLDGTLLDTIEDLTDSMNAALSSMGFPVLTVDACKTLVGDGLSIFIRRALPEAARGDAESVRRLQETMRAEYRMRCAVKTRPYPGIREMLNGLAARGIPMAVLSNKPHVATLSVVGHYFPDVAFRAVLGARENVPIKPDPAGALEIAALLDVPPEEILYLGDTNTDMQTAVAAGFFGVGALWGFRTAAELRGSGARALAERPEDILEWFPRNV